MNNNSGRLDYQKQPPEVLYKKGVLKDSAKFTGKHLCQNLFFNKVAGEPLRCWFRFFPENGTVMVGLLTQT